MKLKSLKKLYVAELRELYHAEKQILSSLRNMEAAASLAALKQAFKAHGIETENQLARLEQIFEGMELSPRGKTSKVTTGLLAEGDKIIKARGNADVKDAGLIAGAQKIEHNEIACYGSAIAHAKHLGEQQAVQLLQVSLDEEYATDKKLTALAENKLNSGASSTTEEGTSVSASEGKSGNLSVAGLLLGAVTGLAIGILLAPNTGTDTRHKIMDTTHSWLDQFGGQLGKLSDIARSAYENNSGSSASSAERSGATAQTGKPNGTSTYNNRNGSANG